MHHKSPILTNPNLSQNIDLHYLEILIYQYIIYFTYIFLNLHKI